MMNAGYKQASCLGMATVACKINQLAGELECSSTLLLVKEGESGAPLATLPHARV